jgi:lysyl-tRNA synthetase class 2
MTSWRPASGPEVATQRASILRRLRAHFDAESVLEVDTPALSSAAISDVQIESLEVKTVLCDKPLFLHTSPEFHMKRLLAAGYPDIYSIARVFRDGEAGRQHQPEFTMVEWYRRDFSLSDIIADTLQVIAVALDKPQLNEDVAILNYRDAFLDTCQIDPLTAPVKQLADIANADQSLRDAIGAARDGWLDLLLTTRVAPSFANDKLTVLRHYPASQAALAQLCPDDTNVADRFEVFMGATELANGYVELRDSREQAARIASDQTERQDRGLLRRPIDEDLIAALESGLPACAGVAMGLERLQSTANRSNDIRDVLTFAFEVSDD